MNRRHFLQGCSTALVAFAGGRITQLSFAAEPTTSDALIVIFLRGGCDGLNFLAPAGDKDYHAARAKDLSVAESGAGKGLLLPHSGQKQEFLLHHSTKPLLELYQAGHLAFVHACGLFSGTRSHFDAMEMMEFGITDTGMYGQRQAGSGWLTRLMEQAHPNGLIPAISVSSATTASLTGYSRAATLSDLDGFGFRGSREQLETLQALYNPANEDHQAGVRTLQTIAKLSDRVSRRQNGTVQPSKGAKYPSGNTLADSLETVAQLLRMDLGLRAATLDYEGWDTHIEQQGGFELLVTELSAALHAFHDDMRRAGIPVTVIVQSEFGRRVKSNDSGGTDHGHGGLMMVLGQAIKGGKVYGEWPGLATDQLDSHLDLAITTDYRAVLAEIALNRFHPATDVARLFPGFKAGTFLGLCG